MLTTKLLNNIGGAVRVELLPMLTCKEEVKWSFAELPFHVYIIRLPDCS
jgi:hypothetical protein